MNLKISRSKVRIKLLSYIALTKVYEPKKMSSSVFAYYTLCATELSYFTDYPLKNALLVTVAVLLTAFGIYTLNDIYDVQEDKINAPHRPIPAGLVTRKEAFILVVVYFILSLICALLISPLTFIMILIFQALGVGYSIPPLRLKRTIFAYLIIGTGMFISTIIGSTVAIPTPKVAYLATIIFLISTFLSPVKDFLAMEGDKISKINTLPLRIGKKKTAKLMASVCFFIVGMILAAPFLYIFNNFYFIFICPSILCMLLAMRIVLKEPEGDAGNAIYLLEATLFLLPLGFTVGSIGAF